MQGRDSQPGQCRVGAQLGLHLQDTAQLTRRRRRLIAGELDLHLLVCPSCRAYLASYQETIDLVRGVAEKEEELAHDAPPELIEAVKHVKK